MFTRPTLWAAIVFAFCGNSSVLADVIISQSNDPTAAYSDRVAVVFGTGHEANTSFTSSLSRAAKEAEATVSRNSSLGEIVAYDKNYLKSLPHLPGGASWKCLSEALYFEARGESVKGIFAVGEVILNRVAHSDFPDDVCGVIYQGTGKRYQCQFTYSCDGQKEVIAEPRAYEKVGKVARLILTGTAPMDLTDGATHYHTRDVNPRWATVYPRTVSIGRHHFYRRGEQIASR